MTHLCYTLEEAAEKLKLSETVLVRLSQYFKVPKAAYEEVGYLSFKGDLAFSEQDIAFFRQAKDHLVTGESLDDVKKRMHQASVAQPPQWTETPQPASSVHQHQAASGVPEAYAKEAESDPGLGSASPIREIQDRKPYEKAAEQSFERYKSMHRNGLTKVFSNMLKEVGVSASKKRSDASLTPGFRPLRDKQADKPGAVKAGKATRPAAGSVRSDALLPFNRHSMAEDASKTTIKLPSSAGSWEHLIQEAASQPRMINTQLKIAAQLLRQRAIGDAGQNESSVHR